METLPYLQTLLLLFCYAVSSLPSGPSLTIPEFSLTTPGKAYGGLSDYLTPLSNITFKPQASCNGGVAVTLSPTLNIETLADVYLQNSTGKFKLASSLDHERSSVSSLWCYSDKGFPKNIAVNTNITLIASFTGVLLMSFPIPSSVVAPHHFSLWTVTNAGISTSDYVFKLSRNHLYVPRGHGQPTPVWGLLCNHFVLGETVICTLEDRQPLPSFDVWHFTAAWQDGDLHYTSFPSNGEWEYWGFVDGIPKTIGKGMEVTVLGHFNYLTSDCQFECPGSNGNPGVHAAMRVHEQTPYLVRCNSPRQLPGIPTGTQCRLFVTFNQTKTLPSAVPPTYTYVKDFSANISVVTPNLIFNGSKTVNGSDQVSLGLNNIVSFTTHTECTAVVFENQGTVVIDIQLNNATYGTSISPQHTTKLHCIDLYNIKSLLLSVKLSANGKSLLNSQVSVHKYFKYQPGWNHIIITAGINRTIAFPNNKPYPLYKPHCIFRGPAGGTPWPLHCETSNPDGSVVCHALSQTRYPLVGYNRTDGGDYGTVTCTTVFPGVNNSPQPATNILPIRIFNSQLRYRGFVTGASVSSIPYNSTSYVIVDGWWGVLAAENVTCDYSDSRLTGESIPAVSATNSTAVCPAPSGAPWKLPAKIFIRLLVTSNQHYPDYIIGSSVVITVTPPSGL